MSRTHLLIPLIGFICVQSCFCLRYLMRFIPHPQFANQPNAETTQRRKERHYRLGFVPLFQSKGVTTLHIQQVSFTQPPK